MHFICLHKSYFGIFIWICCVVVQTKSSPWKSVPGINAKEGKGSRIIGGTQVPDGELPYVVALFIDVNDEVKFHCGGSLISQYHVITAASCIQGWYADRFTVRLSSNHDLDNPSPDEVIVQVATIKKYEYFHFEVSTAIPTNDIAILTLSEPINATQVISLPSQDTVFTAGTVCMTAGWGAIDDNKGSVVPNLYSVDVEMQDYETCVVAYERNMRETMICAGYPEGGKDTCAGDIGGPLVCGGVLTGIVSWGSTVCAEPGKYGVYTNVALYTEWIEKHNFIPQYPPGSRLTIS